MSRSKVSDKIPHNILSVLTILIPIRLKWNINLVRAVVSFKLHIWNWQTIMKQHGACFVFLIYIFKLLINTLNTSTYEVPTKTPYGVIFFEKLNGFGQQLISLANDQNLHIFYLNSITLNQQFLHKSGKIVTNRDYTLDVADTWHPLFVPKQTLIISNYKQETNFNM